MLFAKFVLYWMVQKLPSHKSCLLPVLSLRPPITFTAHKPIHFLPKFTDSSSASRTKHAPDNHGTSKSYHTLINLIPNLYHSCYQSSYDPLTKHSLVLHISFPCILPHISSTLWQHSWCRLPFPLPYPHIRTAILTPDNDYLVIDNINFYSNSFTWNLKLKYKWYSKYNSYFWNSVEVLQLD